MAGNENSGRKSWISELDSKEVSDLSMKTIKSLLKRDDLTIEQQLKLALPIVLKRMPDKIEFDDVNALTRDEKLQIIESIRLLTKQPIMDLTDDAGTITT